MSYPETQMYDNRPSLRAEQGQDFDNNRIKNSNSYEIESFSNSSEHK